jgi:peptidyl-tRNA hydrolase
MHYVIRPEVMKTMGKAMAQAGHAALMCTDYFAEEYAEAFQAWRANDCAGVVLTTDEDWESLKARVDCTYVTDAGLTQVAPGTETVLVIPPTALPAEIMATMRVVA